MSDCMRTDHALNFTSQTAGIKKNIFYLIYGMEENMIYIFSATIVYTLIRQREKLLSKKRDLAIYLCLSAIGLTLGIVYLINPYLPSISSLMEKYIK